MSAAAFCAPDPESAILFSKRPLFAFDSLENGLAVAGPDLLHQVLGAQAARYDVIGEHVRQGLLVLRLQEGIDGTGWQFRKRLVSRGEDREWPRRLQRIDQPRAPDRP